jgi:hypothetical protein
MEKFAPSTAVKLQKETMDLFKLTVLDTLTF